MYARGSAVLLVMTVTGCGGGEKAAPATAVSEPIVAPLELPIALRSQGAAASDAVLVEVSMGAIHVAQKPALELTSGVLSPTDRSPTGQDLPKLVQALNAGPHAKASLAIASLVPYQTVVSVLASLKAAGVGSSAFQVRSPTSTTPGLLALENFDVRDKTGTGNDPGAIVPGVAPRPWADFVSQWDAVANACRGARTGSCTSKPEKVADGGELKIVLHAAGQGVNVEYFRIGAPPTEAAPAEEPVKAGKGHKAGKKKGKKHVELIDGVKAPTDVAAEAEHEPPATEALFQFRGQEALTSPSPVTDTIKPLCGTAACGVVVQAEKATPFLRVVSLLGAAFPDGTSAPRLVFELP